MLLPRCCARRFLVLTTSTQLYAIQRMMRSANLVRQSVTMRFLLSIVGIIQPDAPPPEALLPIVQAMDRDAAESLQTVLQAVISSSAACGDFSQPQPHPAVAAAPSAAELSSSGAQQQATAAAQPISAEAGVGETISEQRSVFALTSLRRAPVATSDDDDAGEGSTATAARPKRTQRRRASELEDPASEPARRRRVEADDDAVALSSPRTRRRPRHARHASTQIQPISIGTGDSQTLPTLIRSFANSSAYYRIFVDNERFLIACTDDSAAFAFVQAAPSTNVAPLDSISEYLRSYRSAPG